MNLEKMSITICGKEYTFLRPMAIQMVEMERKSMIDGEFNMSAYEKQLLEMVSKSIKKEDLVKFVGSDITLSSGVVLSPKQISLEQYETLVDGLATRPVVNTVEDFMSMCGQSKYDISSLTKDDVYAILDACATLYDRTELDIVIEKLNSFC